MTSEQGFWGGMPGRIRWRFLFSVLFLVAACVVLSTSPIAGIILLMSPLLWSVLVTSFGSERGRGYGPHSLPRETALNYTLRYLWQTTAFTRWALSLFGAAIVVTGLGWISTEKMRNEGAEPGLTERAVSAADRATDATKETARGWLSTAKGWFTSEDAAE